MAWLLANLPFLKSPRFWGIVATATFVLGRTKGWIDQDWGTWLQTIAGGATIVGFAGWVVDKSKTPSQ